MSGGASEMLRNEALLLLPALIAGNADLQKIVAFSGAFEKLLDIIQREGGIEGGIIVQDVLVAIGGLLRFNVSNQVRNEISFSVGVWELTFVHRLELLQRVVAHSFTPPNALLPRSTTTSNGTSARRLRATILAGPKVGQCWIGTRSDQNVGWWAWWQQSGECAREC